MEDTVDISVCVLLLLSQRLEITLTAFVTTQNITATGKVMNSCAVLCHTLMYTTTATTFTTLIALKRSNIQGSLLYQCTLY